jgi:hypothetical protein
MIKSRRMRWVGHVARIGKKRNAYRILVGNTEEKRPLGRPRRRWVDKIKIDLRGIGWHGGIGSIWLRRVLVEGSCERCNVPSVSIKGWEVLEWLRNWQLLKKGSAP